MTDRPIRLLVASGGCAARRGGTRQLPCSAARLFSEAGYDVECIRWPAGQRLEAARSAAEGLRRVHGSEGVVLDVGSSSGLGVSVVLRAARQAGVPTLVIRPVSTGESGTASNRGIDRSKALASLVAESCDLGLFADGGWRSVMNQVGLRLEPAPTVGVAPLALRDLDEVAAIHAEAFPDSGITRLGPRVVRRYYEWQFIGPHPAPSALGVWRNGRLVGFLFGGLRYKAIAGFAGHSLGSIAIGAVTRPGSLKRFAVPQVANVAKLMARQPSRGELPAAPVRPKEGSNPDGASAVPSFGVLSIAVASGHQSSGAGRDLLDGATHTAIEQGFERMHLTVGVENTRAVAFYERSGWARDPAGPCWQGRMVRSLSSG